MILPSLISVIVANITACDTHNKAGQKRVRMMSSQDVVTIKDKELGTT